MILRALLVALLNALRRLIPSRTPNAARPAHGPAHPGVLAFVAPATPRTKEPPAAARPLRSPLPPRIAALLAAAPAIEPELAPRPLPALLQTFRSIPSRVRVYNPKPPAPDLRKAQPAREAWSLRLQRAIGRLASLVTAEGPPRGAATG